MLNLTNELTILKQVKHENIVMLVDKWRTEEHYFLLLEYSNGGDLKKMMKKYGGRLSENVVRLITLQIIKAIDYIHEKNIIHRDIKSSNLLVTYPE